MKKLLCAMAIVLCLVGVVWAEITQEKIQQAAEMLQTSLGIDASSETYKNYVSIANELKTHGMDAATFGLLIVEDYKGFLEGAESHIDWKMITK